MTWLNCPLIVSSHENWENHEIRPYSLLMVSAVYRCGCLAGIFMFVSSSTHASMFGTSCWKGASNTCLKISFFLELSTRDSNEGPRPRHCNNAWNQVCTAWGWGAGVGGAARENWKREDQFVLAHVCASFIGQAGLFLNSTEVKCFLVEEGSTFDEV